VRAVQAGHGQHGAPGRDGRGRQVDADLGVVPDRLLGLVQPGASRVEPLGVQFPGPAGGLLRGALAGGATILGRLPEAATCRPMRSRRACLTCASIRSRCSRLTSAAAEVTAAFGGACSAASISSYASRLPPYMRISPPDRSAIWSTRPEQFAVVADDHHHAGPGRHRVVEALARVQVQVVRRLVEQQDVRAAQEQRGQRDSDGLAA
jgi:hypothetical protein